MAAEKRKHLPRWRKQRRRKGGEGEGEEEDEEASMEEVMERGLVINKRRAPGEEEVRIHPALAMALRPHQVRRVVKRWGGRRGGKVGVCD